MAPGTIKNVQIVCNNQSIYYYRTIQGCKKMLFHILYTQIEKNVRNKTILLFIIIIYM